MVLQCRSGITYRNIQSTEEAAGVLDLNPDFKVEFPTNTQNGVDPGKTPCQNMVNLTGYHLLRH